jgi:hypothetical protein
VRANLSLAVDSAAWGGAAALSLLVAVAAAGLWVRGWWAFDQAYVRFNGERRPTNRRAGWGVEWRNFHGGFWATVSGGDNVDWPVPIEPAAAISSDQVINYIPPAPSVTPKEWVATEWGVSFGIGSINYSDVMLARKGRFWGLQIGMPHWLLLAIASALPAAWAWRYRRRRARKARLAANKCVHCGYDLRATPDRCPECGRAAGHCG